jgi:carbamoyl-phosphate synthase small subunit
MKAAISTRDTDLKTLIKRVKDSPTLVGRDLVKEVTCKKPYDWDQGFTSKVKRRGLKVAVLDCGVKHNILRHLVQAGCRVKVVPAATPASEILRLKPDGLLLSNGPGDPAAVTCVIESAKALIGRIPIFGICLGHQMLGLALGGKTYKLKFGHHGGNHPVKDLATQRVAITSQNHGFCVKMESIPDKKVTMTHLNLYDHTPEGLACRRKKLFSVQYHPEAGPGPHDAGYLFEKFIRMIS